MIIHVDNMTVDDKPMISDLTINIVGENQGKIKFDYIDGNTSTPVYYVITDIQKCQIQLTGGHGPSISTAIYAINMITKKSCLINIAATINGVSEHTPLAAAGGLLSSSLTGVVTMLQFIDNCYPQSSVVKSKVKNN